MKAASCWSPTASKTKPSPAIAAPIASSALHAPDFARAVRLAARAGVHFRALRFEPSVDGVWFDTEVPVELEPYELEPVARWSAAFDATSGWVRKDGKVAGRSVTAGSRAR